MKKGILLFRGMKYETFFFCFMMHFFVFLFIEPVVYTKASSEEEQIVEDVISKKNAERDQYLPQIEKIMSGLGFMQARRNGSNTMLLQKGDGMKRGDDTIAAYDMAGAYRVQILDTLLLSAMEDAASFEDAYSGLVEWKVPVTTIFEESGLITILEEDGVLEYIGSSIGENTKLWMITDDAIRNAVLEADILDGDIEKMQIAHSYLYNTAFVYLTSGDKEYLIPFSLHADRIHLTNGKLYTLSEVMKIFNRYFDEQQMVDSPGIYGGAPFRQYPLIPAGAVITVVAILLLITGTALCFRKQKQKKIIR